MREGWTETTLGEVAEVIGGGTPSTIVPEYWDGEIIWLTPTEVVAVDGKTICDSERKLTASGLASSGARLLPKGSVILTSRASVGFVAISECQLSTNQGFQSLVPKGGTLPYFLMYWIQNNRHEFNSRAAGSTFKEISKTNVKSIKLILPPLQEQKRIVDLISSVDTYIDALQHQADSARKSKNAILHEMLSAGGDGWIETILGEVVEINPESTSDHPADKLIRYVDLSMVNIETGIAKDIAPIPYVEAPGRARRVIRTDDVIVSTVRPYLKGFALVPNAYDNEVASTGFCVLRPVFGVSTAQFIWSTVSSDAFVKYLIENSTGSNYPAVRPNDISNFPIQLPTIAEQQHISKISAGFEVSIQSSIDLIVKIKNLRSGLLSDLLSGEHEILSSYDSLIGAA